MTYTTTITSKGQITIPSKILKAQNLKKGQKLLFHIEDGRIFIESPEDMINRLAGSISIPDNLKKVPLEQAIKLAKQVHFSQKNDLLY